jgi:hypothetical protein
VAADFEPVESSHHLVELLARTGDGGAELVEHVEELHFARDQAESHGVESSPGGTGFIHRDFADTTRLFYEKLTVRLPIPDGRIKRINARYSVQFVVA